MKYLLIGIILSITGVILSIGLWGLNKAYFITGAIGLFFIVLSIVMSGSIVGPHRMRANLASEPEEDRQKRKKSTFHISLIGLINIITAILLYYFIN